MLTKLSLSILLILTCSTVLLGQITDTSICYGITDLRKIAIKLTTYNELDTLLKISKLQLIKKDSIIFLQTSKELNCKKTISLLESVIDGKTTELESLKHQLNVKEKKFKLIKFGLGTVSITILGGVLYGLFR
jgi:hypothetical protein